MSFIYSKTIDQQLKRDNLEKFQRAKAAAINSIRFDNDDLILELASGIGININRITIHLHQYLYLHIIILN